MFHLRYILFSALFIVTAAIPLEAKKICVDQNAVVQGIGSGKCWDDPFLSLQDALDAARSDKSITTIFIADGIYRPSKTYSPEDENGDPVLAGAFSLPENNPGIQAGSVGGNLIDYADDPSEFNERLKTFDLVDKVNIFGGFQGQSHPKGGEKNASQRSQDKSQYQTILDGDLDGNPATDDNVWHVLTAGNDIAVTGIKAFLDRLVIRNGNANLAPFFPINFPLNAGQVPIYYHDDGAGLYVFVKSEIWLNDIEFRENQAIAGAGLFAHDGSKIIISHSLFTKNSTPLGDGGLTVRSGGPLTELTNKRVSKVILMNSEFLENNGGAGGAIITSDNYIVPPEGRSGVDMTIWKSKFIKNNSSNNGTIIQTGGKLTVFYSEFRENFSQVVGGISCNAIFNSPEPRPGTLKVFGSKFVANQSGFRGGAGGTFYCSSVWKNNEFIDNISDVLGGALAFDGGGTNILKKNLFQGNFADVVGGAIFVIAAPDGTLPGFPQTPPMILDIIGNSFIDNSAPGFGGGAIFTDSTFNPVIIRKNVNNTFSGNTPNDIQEFP